MDLPIWSRPRERLQQKGIRTVKGEDWACFPWDLKCRRTAQHSPLAGLGPSLGAITEEAARRLSRSKSPMKNEGGE